MRVELPIVGFISVLLVLIPLPLHWKAGNVCVISATLWLAVCNAVYGINATIWGDGVAVKYEVWCDIASRIIVGANIGLPASGMCICRRLAYVSSPYYQAPSLKDKKRHINFEIGMCAILPIVAIALGTLISRVYAKYPSPTRRVSPEVIVEAKRFAIQEVFGCTTWLRYSIPALLIVNLPPVLLSLTETLYAGIALRWLIHRRAQFRRASHDTQLTPASGAYLRLFVFTVAEMIFATIVSMFVTIQGFQIGILPRTSWEDVHKDWLEIPQVPRDAMPEIYWMNQMFAWYIPPLASVMHFGFFGFDDRVVATYKYWFEWIKAHTFRIESGKTPVLPPSTSDAIPVQILTADTSATTSSLRGNTSPV